MEMLASHTVRRKKGVSSSQHPPTQSLHPISTHNQARSLSHGGLRHSHLDVLSLHALPLHKRRAHNAHRARRHTNIKCLRQAQVVSSQHAWQELLLDLVLQLGCANAEHKGRVEVGHDGVQVLDELVGEDVLADGDEEGAAEGLAEHHGGGADGDVFGRENGLHRDEDLLHAEAHAGAEEELVTDPLCGVGVGFEGGEEAGADGH